jgi:aspartyl-tRNA(Asn)/glutamyl-tRNA(Gln) amidotransferase subunit C
MSLTLEEVEHIAQLSRLELSEEEKTRYREQLSAILDYVAKLQELKMSDVEPTAAVLSEDSQLRPDRTRAPLSRRAVLKNAAETEEGQFKLPPVFPPS